MPLREFVPLLTAINLRWRQSRFLSDLLFRQEFKSIAHYGHPRVVHAEHIATTARGGRSKDVSATNL
jgi:hypothetical protein